MEDLIKRFLSVSYGDGSGSGSGYDYGSGSGDDYGDGSGDGDGYGSDYGSGSGSGYGYGYGDGDGDGSGDGSGVNIINGHKVYSVDDTQTVFYSIKGNYTKCSILKKDLTLQPCFVAKVGNYFAHGTTLKQAFADANAKFTQNLSEAERIAMFEAKFKWGELYPIKDFYDWHNTLTGSCKFGRDSFAEQNSIDMNGTMTVEQFIELTKNAYGGTIITKLFL